MRELRLRVREQERRLGRSCPIVARIPDNAAWLLLAYGLDVQEWLASDLIDGIMLSPFPLAVEDPNQYPEERVAEAHRFGKTCVGGIGSLGLWRLEGSDAPDFHPHSVYALAARLYEAGVDGLSVYQTESLVGRPWLEQLLQEIDDPQVVAARTAELPASPTDYPVGMDWHSRYDRSWPRLPRRQPHTLRLSAGAGAAL